MGEKYGSFWSSLAFAKFFIRRDVQDALGVRSATEAKALVMQLYHLDSFSEQFGESMFKDLSRRVEQALSPFGRRAIL